MAPKVMYRSSITRYRTRNRHHCRVIANTAMTIQSSLKRVNLFWTERLLASQAKPYSMQLSMANVLHPTPSANKEIPYGKGHMKDRTKLNSPKKFITDPEAPTYMKPACRRQLRTGMTTLLCAHFMKFVQPTHRNRWLYLLVTTVSYRGLNHLPMTSPTSHILSLRKHRTQTQAYAADTSLGPRTGDK